MTTESDEAVDEEPAGDPPKPSDDGPADKPAGMVPVGELAAERKRRQALEAKIAELSDREKSELEKLTEKISKTEADANATRQSLARLEVALEAAPEGMPISKVRSLAKRLSGDTREELLADAEELFGEFGNGKPPSGQPKPKPKGGPDPVAGDDEVDPEALANEIISRSRPW